MKKQTMVVKVSMNDGKSRSKALKIAVSLLGVESASLKGDDKSQIEVTGDGVDPVKLTRLLRKNVGYAELVSVGAAGDGEKKEEKKDEKKEEKKEEPTPIWIWQEVPPSGYVDQYGPCSIL